jgi:hypothetical protein
MGPICIGFLPYFCRFFVLVFSLGCVYLCSHLPCTFDIWVSILDIYIYIYMVFLFLKLKFFHHKYNLNCKPFVNCCLPLLALPTKARILCLDSL